MNSFYAQSCFGNIFQFIIGQPIGFMFQFFKTLRFNRPVFKLIRIVIHNHLENLGVRGFIQRRNYPILTYFLYPFKFAIRQRGFKDNKVIYL